MYRIAVVGDRDSVLGFKAAGFSTFPVKDEREAASVISKLTDEECAVIFITDDMAAELTEVFDRYRERRIPAIIPIPGNRGSRGIGMLELKKAVERAVGADILKEE